VQIIANRICCKTYLKRICIMYIIIHPLVFNQTIYKKILPRYQVNMCIINVAIKSQYCWNTLFFEATFKSLTKLKQRLSADEFFFSLRYFYFPLSISMRLWYGEQFVIFWYLYIYICPLFNYDSLL